MRLHRTDLVCSLLTLALVGCGPDSRQTPPAPPSFQPAQRKASPPGPTGDPREVYIQVVGTPLIIGHVLPLTDAVSNLQTKRVKELLDAGADPNVREENASSWPPLAFAMKGSTTNEGVSEPDYNAMREIMNLLLARGADP